MATFFVLYGLFALSHIVFQVILGNLHYRREKQERAFNEQLLEHNGGYDAFAPNVAVFMPVYNEEPDILRKALTSLKNQKYNGRLRFYVIDDGSKNGSEIAEVFSEFDPKIEGEVQRFFFKRIENRGKRIAQYNAMSLMQVLEDDAEIIVTIDSDTVIQPRGISEIVKPFKSETIGAVTGHVMVTNKFKNLLTELIGYRYWMAFNQERAAQSYFKVLMCCSGPFSAFRRKAFEAVSWQYINQTFLGKKCTYGDDRHLTNLFLENGWDIVYTNYAQSYTQVPETFKQYVKQQVRWNRSFYREMLWTLKSVNRHHWYLIYDLVMQFALPFLLIAALVNVFTRTITEDWRVALAYLSVMILVGLLRVSYALWRTKDTGFLKFLGYGLFHVFVLIPVRLYALATIRDSKWGTR